MKENNNRSKIVILGAGISGLSIAFELSKQGFDVTVLEESDRPGGSMETRKEAGYLMDLGPTILVNTTPLIGELVQNLGLEKELICTNENSKKSYVLRDNKLHCLPINPTSFLKTRLLSPKAKARVLLEPFIGKSADGFYQSVSDFVRRRFGREFLDYAINPFVAGVNFGDPDRLSIKSAFPQYYRLEEVDGCLVKGMARSFLKRPNRRKRTKAIPDIFSFRNGLQTLPTMIAKRLSDRVQYNCPATNVDGSDTGFTVSYESKGNMRTMAADMVVSALPAYRASGVFEKMAPVLSDHLNRIEYPPVKVFFVGFPLTKIGQKLDGSWFFIPAKEKRSFLGALWYSVIFTERSPDRMAAFSLLVGGNRDPGIVDRDPEALLHLVLDEFREIMKIDPGVPPSFIREKLWPRAIPQYNTGHIEMERYFRKAEIEYPGLFLGGNYRGGIAVGDCIAYASKVCERIRDFTKNFQAQ